MVVIMSYAERKVRNTCQDDAALVLSSAYAQAIFGCHLVCPSDKDYSQVGCLLGAGLADDVIPGAKSTSVRDVAQRVRVLVVQLARLPEIARLFAGLAHVLRLTDMLQGRASRRMERQT